MWLASAVTFTPWRGRFFFEVPRFVAHVYPEVKTVVEIAPAVFGTGFARGLDLDRDFGLLGGDLEFRLLSWNVRCSSVPSSFFKRTSVAEELWSIETWATWKRVV